MRVVEKYGSSSMTNSYEFSSSIYLSGSPNRTHSYSRRGVRSLSQFFRSVFLPQGYPESVSDDYLSYQIWDTVQAFASGITGSLATQAVLKGVGVGDESATVLAATITWLMKDGLSMVGRIFFAWKLSSDLDSDCKRWRLFADVINDVAILLDILASYFTQYFRMIVCLSGMMRAIVGVAGGATRAALTQHQARRNNMADVSAKDGSQETMVNLAALICSLLIMPLVSNNQSLVWFLFLSFTCLHLYANYSAVTAVCMDTFNQTRLHIAVSHSLAQQLQLSSNEKQGIFSQLLDVRRTNLHEPVLFSIKRKMNINIGCSLAKLSTAKASLPDILSLFRDHPYAIGIVEQLNEINIVLSADSNYEDQLKACLHAEVIDFCYTHFSPKYLWGRVADREFRSVMTAVSTGDVMAVLNESLTLVDKQWSEFCLTARAHGWKTHPVQFSADEWRANWRDFHEEGSYEKNLSDISSTKDL